MQFLYGLSDFATLTGEQLRERTPEELAALPPVAAKLQEAEDQARRYGAALRERYGLTDPAALRRGRSRRGAGRLAGGDVAPACP